MIASMGPDDIRVGLLLIVPAGTCGNKKAFRVRVDRVLSTDGNRVGIVATKVRPNGDVITEWALYPYKVNAIRYLTIDATQCTPFTPDQAEE